MNWYKQSSTDLPSWLAKELAKISGNYKLLFPSNKAIQNIMEWVKKNNPTNLNEMTLYEVWAKAKEEALSNLYRPNEFDKMKLNDQWPFWMESNRTEPFYQNFYPDLPDFRVKMSKIPPIELDPSLQSAINMEFDTRINNILHDKPPFHIIIDICKKYDVIIVTTGTGWLYTVESLKQQAEQVGLPLVSCNKCRIISSMYRGFRANVGINAGQDKGYILLVKNTMMIAKWCLNDNENKLEASVRITQV